MDCSGSCTLRRQAIYFSIFTICHGAALMIFHCSNSFIHWNKKDERVKYFKFIALSLTHTVSGILMLIGVLKNIKFIYIPGLLLSFIMPIVVANTVFVYMLVIQIIFAILACRFICFM